LGGLLKRFCNVAVGRCKEDQPPFAWLRYESCLAGMASNAQNFPPEVSSVPVASPDAWKGSRALCRCGMPLGPDPVDEYGYRIATPLSVVCMCVIAQRAIDS
jgi:hypothetical protein